MKEKTTEGQIVLALIAHDNKKDDMVAFWWTRSIRTPTSRTYKACCGWCNVHDVPLATNLATAEILIAGLADKDSLS